MTNQTLINLTLAQVEYYYKQGVITYGQLLAYVWLWRNCTQRKSSLYKQFECSVDNLLFDAQIVLRDIKNSLL